MLSSVEIPPAVGRKLDEQGFSEAAGRLLPLVPALRVAWSDGFLQAGERRVLLDIFDNQGLKDEEYKRILLWWLDERPSDEFFAEATEILSEWLAGDSSQSAAVLRDFLHASCLRTAQASATIGLKRNSQTVCREERRQLELIGNQFGFTLA